ncbi:MAG TPA: type 4a pilus biogenesis protein PilO [Actinomycetota bacterium]|nr:type 4a pilus biogenesis protein PilO [Actinomycetota bacterium]
MRGEDGGDDAVNRRAPFIAGAIALAVAILAVFFLVLPKMNDVSETQDQLQAAEDQETTLEAELRSLQDAEQEAPQTEQEIAAIDAAVPPTADLPELFRLLQSAADRSAVDFFSFTPGTSIVNATSSYSTIASQITVSGGYFAIDEFLFLLETLQRAAKVTTLAITPGTAGATTTTSGNTLQLQMTVEFYTTDTSAGPGSIPGPTEGATTGA